MKLLVTGAGGAVGSAVVELASGKYDVYSVYNSHYPSGGRPMRLNLLDTSKVADLVAILRPDAVVHAAALTDVEKCEREYELADAINHKSTRILAEAAKRIGAYFLYVSTDYVFDGAKGFYSEDDSTNPISTYGLTKLRGEQSVELVGGEFCIARGSVIYGARPAAGKVNFALWLTERLRRHESTNVVRDQIVSPTFDLNFASMVVEALDRHLTGTYHFAGATRISRYQFAVTLAEGLGADPSLIKPVLMSQMNWTAKRPKDSSLSVTKATSIMSEKPLTVAEAISEFSRSMTKGGL